MSKEAFLIVSILTLLALVGLGILGWTARRRQQRDIPAPEPVPPAFRPLLEAAILYVATTRAEDAYDRVAVHGLGLRSRARILIGELGVILELPDRDVFTPAGDITQVQRATWTIDRVVEPGGLLRYSWTLGPHAVATNIRVIGDDQEVLDALLRLHPNNDTAESASAERDS